MSFRKIQTSNIDTSDAAFSDPILILGKDNSGISDIGFLGKIGINNYAGFVRDAETQTFYVIDGYIGAESSNQIEAAQITQKGNLTVGVLTADTIIAGNIPSTLSDLTDIDNGTATTGDLILYDGSTWSYVNLESEINTRITASQTSQPLIGLSDVGHTSDTVANGDFLLYDSSTSKFAFVDFASEVIAYADARVGVALSNTVSLTGSLNGNVTGRLYGDVHGDVTSPTSLVPIITTGPVKDTLTIHDAEVEKLKAPSSSGGATIVNTTGADTFFGHNAYLTGSLYGDIGDTLAHNPVLTVGTGNNDSQLGVTVASIDELAVNNTLNVTNATITGLDISDLTDANNVIQPNDLSNYSTTAVSNLFVQQQDLIAKTAAVNTANAYTNGQITTVTSTLQSYANAPTTWVAPKGTEAQRPASPVEGQFYFNTDTKIFEGYDGTNWIQLVPSTLQIIP